MRWFQFRCDEILFVNLKFHESMYLWNSWEIRCLNCLIVIEILFCLTKNLSQSSTKITITFAVNSLINMYLSFFFDWFNISKYWNHMIINSFWFCLNILKKTLIVILIMSATFSFSWNLNDLSNNFLKRDTTNVLLKTFVDIYLWRQFTKHSLKLNIKILFRSSMSISWFFIHDMFIIKSNFFNCVIKHQISFVWFSSLNLI